MAKKLYSEEELILRRREQKARWRAANPEKQREYRESIRDKQAEYMRIWTDANRESVNARNRAWSAANPDSRLNRVQVYRARLAGASIIEDVDRMAVFDRDGWICQICLEPVDAELRGRTQLSPSLDHIIPLSQDGDHSYDNTQLAHMSCNQQKGRSTWHASTNTL